ncbi:hypothetical protein TpMuguga_02g00866 [Theileria parva strain Muguga]|uniref:Uncharacterized protein n=1 Tax=Theileria parva TaxID=5875 RepID=Q4N3X2_THEPA|nr:uncharacterized protein TpMuguga_02g00866 [Theileria parva strain Muguga]EAN33151.1 hypothetical protein TpMuguga_02g00866 [Theileria parva strain Muguga]|eukprot:XP_765434.1 hypothetical protein [Theileria parva strain Muguga]
MYWPYQRLTGPSETLRIILILLNMAAELQYKAELVDGKPVLYSRTNFEGSWRDITHTRHNLDDLELYDLNLNLTTVSQCRTELKGFTMRIITLFLCYHVKLGDKLLWSYAVEPFHGLPTEILFNLKNNTMSLLFEENVMEILSMEGYENDWVEPGKQLQKPDDWKLIENANTETCLFSDNDPCLGMKLRGRIIWIPNEDEPSPISIIFEDNTNTLVFPNYYTVFDSPND